MDKPCGGTRLIELYDKVATFVGGIFMCIIAGVVYILMDRVALIITLLVVIIILNIACSPHKDCINTNEGLFKHYNSGEITYHQYLNELRRDSLVRVAERCLP